MFTVLGNFQRNLYSVWVASSSKNTYYVLFIWLFFLPSSKHRKSMKNNNKNLLNVILSYLKMLDFTGQFQRQNQRKQSRVNMNNKAINLLEMFPKIPLRWWRGENIWSQHVHSFHMLVKVLLDFYAPCEQIPFRLKIKYSRIQHNCCIWEILTD